MGHVHNEPDGIRQRVKSFIWAVNKTSRLKPNSPGNRESPSVAVQMLHCACTARRIGRLQCTPQGWRLDQATRTGRTERRGTPNFGSLFLADGRASGIPQPSRGRPAGQPGSCPLASVLIEPLQGWEVWAAYCRCACPRPHASLAHLFSTRHRTLVLLSNCWGPARATCLAARDIRWTRRTGRLNVAFVSPKQPHPTSRTAITGAPKAPPAISHRHSHLGIAVHQYRPATIASGDHGHVWHRAVYLRACSSLKLCG